MQLLDPFRPILQAKIRQFYGQLLNELLSPSIVVVAVVGRLVGSRPATGCCLAGPQTSKPLTRDRDQKERESSKDDSLRSKEKRVCLPMSNDRHPFRLNSIGIKSELIKRPILTDERYLTLCDHL